MSDTVVQFVPLQNFPPAVGFVSGFEPLRNLQREFVYEGEAVVDTIYWNYGITNFRLFAIDLDGTATMDSFYLYTLSDIEPAEVRDHDDPLADAEVDWIRTPFPDDEAVRRFEVYLEGVAAGERTLTVSVGDEADAETRFTYPWTVRAPEGEVLFIPDSTPPVTRQFHADFADGYFGVDGWGTLEFWIGFPDDPRVLLETLRLFSAVVWFDGGGTSQVFEEAADRDGPLQNYVDPPDGAAPGRLLVISAAVCGGASGLPNPFIQQVLGISPTGSPQSALEFQPGHTALGLQPHLPTMTAASTLAWGIGMNPLSGTEALYQMESCQRCYTNRPPWMNNRA
jgi:hypothetical protein